MFPLSSHSLSETTLLPSFQSSAMWWILWRRQTAARSTKSHAVRWSWQPETPRERNGDVIPDDLYLLSFTSSSFIFFFHHNSNILPLKKQPLKAGLCKDCRLCTTVLLMIMSYSKNRSWGGECTSSLPVKYKGLKNDTLHSELQGKRASYWWVVMSLFSTNNW